jgi:hypothetical protein
MLNRPASLENHRGAANNDYNDYHLDRIPQAGTSRISAWRTDNGGNSHNRLVVRTNLEDFLLLAVTGVADPGH